MVIIWFSLLLTECLSVQNDPPALCEIPIIKNGQVIGNQNKKLKEGESLTVQCGLKYDISSDELSVCQADGTYKPREPTCDAVACTAPKIEHGQTSPSTIDPGKTVTIICSPGYILNNNAVLTCITKDVFSTSSFPSCVAQNCNPKVNVQNGQITGPTPIISPGVTLMIQCNQGYKKDGNINITCVTENVFDPPDKLDSVCLAQKCNAPDVPNGKVTNQGAIKPSDDILIKCDDQYVKTPDVNVKCLSLNKFEPENLPVCKAQECPPKDITKGSCPKALPGEPFDITCATNYQPSNMEEFTCVSGSLFSPDKDFPTCQAKDCVIEPIPNGEIEGSSTLEPGQTATLNCGNNYLLVGVAVMECVAGTQFKNTLPKCEAFPCPFPVVTNGKVTAATTKGKISAGSALTISCDEPYAKEFDTTVKCVTEKVFNPSILPTCVRTICSTPNIKNGAVTGPETLTPDSKLIIQCNTGYVISHSEDVFCFSKGVLSSVAGVIDDTTKLPLCQAQDCAKPGDSYVDHGQIIGPESISPTETYTIQCDNGYTLIGSAVITCVTGEIFAQDYPTCQANPCQIDKISVINGRVINRGSQISPGREIEIECNTNYKRSHDTVVTCVAGTTYSSPLPVCSGYPCPPKQLPEIKNGKYSTAADFSSQANITVDCDKGYETVPGTAVCQSKSYYTGTLPSCKAVNCVFPETDFENGTIINNGNIKPEARISFKCNEGYKLFPITPVRCVTESITDPSVLPKCQVQACPIPVIAHGAASQTAALQHGEKLAVVCDPNYLLTGNAVSCVTGEVWSGDLPTCQATACDPKPDIPNGGVTNTNYIKPGDRITVACSVSYKLTHSDISVCVTNNTYSPPLPQCLDKECPFPTIDNGTVSPDNNGKPVRPSTNLTLACDRGYDIFGAQDFMCVRHNNFQPALPSCVPRPCDKPVVLNGTVSPGPANIQPGETVTVTCQQYKYVIRGDVYEQEIRCVALDTFSPPVPTCRAIPCAAPDDAHGKVESGLVMAPDAVLRLTCHDGYVLSHSRPVKCVANNTFTDGVTWSYTVVPTCKPVNCVKSEISIEHGEVTNTETEIQPGTQVTIKCEKEFYELSHNNAVECVTRKRSGNEYSTKLPTCKPLLCERPTIEHGSVVNDPSTAIQPDDRITLQCDGGYTINDTRLLYCITASRYSLDPLPSCIRNCVDNGKLDFAKIASTSKVHPGAKMTIECKEGYEKVAPREIVRCVTYKTYNPLQPKGCKPVPCPIPDLDGLVVVSNTAALNPGEQLLFSCPEIYSQSVGKATCVSGHLFDPTTPQIFCADRPCPVPEIPHATTRHTESLHAQDQLLYTCDKGYYSDTPSRVYCDTYTVFVPRLPNCEPRNCYIPKIDGASITPTTLGPGAAITINCRDGKQPDHKASGKTFTCITEDQYSIMTPLPKCVAVNCTRPDVAHSINVPEAELAPGERFTVECDPNYLLEGTETATCYSGTVFRGTLPRCAARDCKKPVIPNGIVSTQDKITPNSELILRCGDGYINPHTTSFTCVSYELYEPKLPPQCIATECPRPEIAYAKSNTSATIPGHQLIIECERGYKLDCDTVFRCVTGHIYQPNSKLPECKPQLCDKQAVENGNITGPDPITPGSNLTIQCIAGKAINAHIMPQCIHTTKFQPQLTNIKCVDAINCTFGRVPHGSVAERNVAPGIHTELRCEEGYSPHPADARVFCVVQDIHYPPNFNCYRTQCNVPTITNGYVMNSVLYKGDRLEVQCQTGYSNPYSVIPVTCISGDTFSHNGTLACVRVEECVVPAVAHGRVAQRTLPIGSVVRVLCEVGYYDPYHGGITCTDTGTISHSNIACQKCDGTYSNTDGVITSPMFAVSGRYPNNTRCTYTLLAKDHKNIQIELNYVNLECTETCHKDYLAFYDGNTTTDKLLLKVCCTEGTLKRSVRQISGSSNVMTVVFSSDGEVSGAGFTFGYAAYVPSGSSNTLKIVLGVLIPLVLLLLLAAVLLYLYMRYWRNHKELYDQPQKNFHWNEGGPIDNAYFHYIANGGQKPPPTMAEKLEAAQARLDDETDSIVSTSSRAQLTDRRPLSNVSYSTIKLGCSKSNLNTPKRMLSPATQSHISSVMAPSTARSIPPSHISGPLSNRSVPVSHRSTELKTVLTPASSNYNSVSDQLDKFSHKKDMEGLGLSDKDFKLNLPYLRGSGQNNLSETESEESMTRTALEDTLLDGDPLQHTVLSDEVLRSPETMRALEKLRAGARKTTGPRRNDDPNSENYEMKQQNRILSERELVRQRREYEAGYRRPLPPNISNI